MSLLTFATGRRRRPSARVPSGRSPGVTPTDSEERELLAFIDAYLHLEIAELGAPLGDDQVSDTPDAHVVVCVGCELGITRAELFCDRLLDLLLGRKFR